MSLALIQKQLQADYELRSVVVCATVSFVCLFLSYTVSTHLTVAALLACTPTVFYVSRRNNWKIQCTVQAGLLGSVAGLSSIYSILHSDDAISSLSRYFLLLSVFHFTEYIFTALSNRRSLQPDSFLLNHSVGYWAAASVSWLEFLTEYSLIPITKCRWISMVGVFGCILGEIIRKAAMMQAGHGFTHRLAMTKRPDHQLVTDGIYAWIRHPGYCGWLIWAVSTQIVLCNPICAAVYAYVSWQFFAQRVVDEERDLIKFFGINYQDYQTRVWSGIPFVSGYRAPSPHPQQ